MALFIFELVVCCAIWFALGYALGLRETKRRLKAHHEVTDRLMNAGLSASTANRLTEHDDMINAAALSMLGGSHGGFFLTRRNACPGQQ